MSLDDSPDPELTLALVYRNSLARSLLLRTRRAHTLDPARSLRTLSQLGAPLSRRPPAADAAIPRLLAEAARRVREHAAHAGGQG